MSKLNQRLCILSGPIAMALFGVGLFMIAGLVPPPAPTASINDVAALYQGKQVNVQLGIVVVLVAAGLFPPFFAVLAEYLRRMEGAIAPLSTTLVIFAAFTSVLFYLGAMMIAVTAFRPFRSPELTQLMNDLAWITLVSPGAPAAVMNLAIGLGILGDRSATPVLPRWTGYFSLWMALLYLPAQMCVMLASGPFAWNGLLSFWVGAISFVIWTNVMGVVMYKRVQA